MVHPTFGRKPDTTIVERIAFLDTGREFEIIRDGEFVGVALKQLVLDMGLDWKSQHRKVNKHKTLTKGMVKLTIPTKQGGEQETTCLSLRYLPYYLATLSPGSIKDDDIRARVEMYQEYAVDILFDATFGQLEAQTQRQQQELALQDAELVQLRQSSESLRVQYELFDDIERIDPRRKLNGLLNLYSGPGNSYQVLYRLLGRECSFDVYAIRDEIVRMGGKATLIAIVEAHKMLDKALEIAGRMIQTLQAR